MTRKKTKLEQNVQGKKLEQHVQKKAASSVGATWTAWGSFLRTVSTSSRTFNQRYHHHDSFDGEHFERLCRWRYMCGTSSWVNWHNDFFLRVSVVPARTSGSANSYLRQWLWWSSTSCSSSSSFGSSFKLLHNHWPLSILLSPPTASTIWSGNIYATTTLWQELERAH